jgi:glycerol-3-phosphate acyltransferase PlsX
MAAATLEIGRVKGIQRPAIATILPTPTGGLVLLDSGANADARPEMLAQFAQMGTAYASLILGIEQPRLALLNIGGEASKGSALAIESYKLLEEQFSNFIGNVEGTALLSGVCDVVVTDGFTGNIALKLIEGTTSVLFREIKKVFTSKAKNKLAAAIVNNDLRALKDRFNAEAVGGAPLLGCKGAVVIGHGSSTAKAIANGIKLTAAIAGSRIADLLAGQNAQDSATATG